ncbi:hypothetical protein [Campylobacter concisus]|uniref:hypothetical protein n=1 Tax=Campylobacter concisus TaxID=199 RepID=UPI001E3A6B44|nr:hypothetical protein [Campylobacter concisus]
MARLPLIIPKHVIAICEGACYDPEVLCKKSLCKQGCVNVLTRNKGTLASLKQVRTQGISKFIKI